jgi:acyl-CoA thioester hydrolase
MPPERAAPSAGAAPIAYPVAIEMQVRFRDLDTLRHVNNSVFMTYLEAAREAYWNALGHRLDLDGYGFILARIECDFRAPILYAGLDRSWVRVRIRCPRFGTKSWEYEYRVEARMEDRDAGTLYATARSVQVYAHIPTGRSEPLPPEIRAKIERLEGRG